MAKEKKKADKKPVKQEKKQEQRPDKKPVKQEKYDEILIRILATDISGNKSIYSGLTNIKGISWGLSAAVCKKLKLDRKKKVKDITKEEITKISEFIKNLEVPEFMLNRRRDLETGESKHLIGADLDLRKEFDIKRQRKIRSYKGFRHATGQPVRGQRTRGHFRKNKVVGVVGKKKR